MDLLWKFALITCIFGLSTASRAGKLDEETKDLRNTVDEDTGLLEPSVNSNLYMAISQINKLRENAQTTGLPAPKTIRRPVHKPHHVVDTFPSLNDQFDISKIVPSPTARMVIGQHEEVQPREKRCLTCGNMGGGMGNDLQPDGNRNMGGMGFNSGSSSGSFSGFSGSSGGASQADFARVLQAFGGGSASDAFSQQEFSRILNQMGSSGGFQSMGLSGGSFQGRSSLSQSEINQMLAGMTGMSGSGSSGQTTKGDFARILIQFDRSGGNLGSSGMSGASNNFGGMSGSSNNFGGMSGSSSGSFSGMSESSGSASADFARILQMFGGGSTTDSFSQQDFSRVLNQMGSGSSGSSGMSGFSFQGKSSLSQQEINQLLAGITGMQGSGSSGQTTKGDFAKILIQYGSSGQSGSGMGGGRQKVIVQQPQQVFVAQPQPVDVVKIPIRIVSGGNDVQPDQVVNQNQFQQQQNVDYQQQQQQQQYQQQQYQQQQYQQQQYQQQQQQQQQYQQVNQYQPQNNKPVLTLINQNGGTMVYSTGSYTLQGAMQTEVKNGYTYTYSTYTKIIDATPTIGVITLVAMQTFYAGQLVPQGQNPYGVPNVGVYTLPGSMSAFQSNGYPFTVSSFTKIVDGVATYGAITLAGIQTYFNDKLLQPGQNPYGVPNQGTYTLNGEMRPIQISGYPATVSTYTKIVDGVATYGTITLGSLQTFYNNKLLLPGQNPYGVPNEGTHTLAGQMSSFFDNNGYPVTVSTYTRVINGHATFGTITKGTQMTMYDGRILRYGENPFGVPNEGVFTRGGGLSYVDVNGQTQTRTTVTKFVNGQPTYITLTIMPMQTTYYPNDRGATMIMQGGSGGVCEVCGK